MKKPFPERGARSVFTFFVVAVLGIASTGATLDGFRQDEVVCEEAAQRLITCCGAAYSAPNLECSYESGCGTTQYPAIDQATSECIQSSTCDDLVAHGVCQRAANIAAKVVTEEDAGTQTAGGANGVCP